MMQLINFDHFFKKKYDFCLMFPYYIYVSMQAFQYELFNTVKSVVSDHPFR